MVRGGWGIGVYMIVRSDEMFKYESIDFEFGSSPVSSFGVVPDLVIAFVSEPVGQGSVLPLFLSEPLLHEEGFVSSHFMD